MVFVRIFSSWIYLLLFPHRLIVLFIYYLRVYVLPPCNPWAESDCCNGARPNLKPHCAWPMQIVSGWAAGAGMALGSCQGGRKPFHERLQWGDVGKEEENLSRCYRGRGNSCGMRCSKGRGMGCASASHWQSCGHWPDQHRHRHGCNHPCAQQKYSSCLLVLAQIGGSSASFPGNGIYENRKLEMPPHGS